MSFIQASILLFPSSSPLCRNFQLLLNSQSRFGQFSYLPFRPAPPLYSATSSTPCLLEVSWFRAHPGSIPCFWFVNSLNTGSRVIFPHLNTGSQSAGFVSGTKSSLLSHLTLLCCPSTCSLSGLMLHPLGDLTCPGELHC